MGGTQTDLCGHKKQLKERPRSIKKGTLTISEYMNQVKIVVNMLAAIGAPVPDKMSPIKSFTDSMRASNRSLTESMRGTQASPLTSSMKSSSTENSHLGLQ